jgi:hypothetical protein
MIVLWLPMLQMVTGFPRQAAVDENRKLAPAPVLKSWSETKQYMGDAIKWFDDNFGFRGFLIRSKTQVDFSAFGISTRVYVGSDGWLFYRSVINIEQPQIELILKKDSDNVIQGTRNLAAALKARGVKLIVMITPMKDVFYSKYLPESVAKLPAHRQVDMLQDRLKTIKEITFIDSTSIMRNVANERTVFHRTDFHWNDPAAFEVARVLVNEIGRLEGRADPVWKHILEIEEKPSSGGEAAFMPIYFPPKEKALFVKQNWEQPPYSYIEKQIPFEWIYEAKQPTGNELPPMVVLGDSFFDGMLRSGIWTHFGKVYRARTNDTNIKEIVEKLPKDTKYLLLEFIETDKRQYSGLASEGYAK